MKKVSAPPTHFCISLFKIQIQKPIRKVLQVFLFCFNLCTTLLVCTNIIYSMYLIFFLCLFFWAVFILLITILN